MTTGQTLRGKLRGVSAARAGGKTIEVGRFTITVAGRRALEG